MRGDRVVVVRSAPLRGSSLDVVGRTPAGLLLDMARPGHFALDVHVGRIPAGQGRVTVKWRTFVVSVLDYVHICSQAR